MVVAELDIVRITGFKSEADPPLVIYCYRMLPGAITLEGMETIAWGRAKIGHMGGSVNRLQPAQRPAGDVWRNLAGGAGAEEFFCRSVGEGLDHATE